MCCVPGRPRHQAGSHTGTIPSGEAVAHTAGTEVLSIVVVIVHWIDNTWPVLVCLRCALFAVP